MLGRKLWKDLIKKQVTKNIAVELCMGKLTL